jgi:hypothetical protein
VVIDNHGLECKSTAHRLSSGQECGVPPLESGRRSDHRGKICGLDPEPFRTEQAPAHVTGGQPGLVEVEVDEEGHAGCPLNVVHDLK